VYPAVSTAGAYSIVYQGATTTAAVHAVSIWLRGNVGGEQVYIGVLTGVGSTPRITLTTQWRRYTYITPTLTAAGNFFMVGTDLRDTNQAATSAQTIYAWGGQIEAIGYVTSYISTVGAAVTRAADVLSYPTTAIPGFSATAMTVVCEADLLATPGVTGVLIASDGTTNNRVQFAAFGGSLFTTVTAGGVNGVANPEAASTVAIGNVWKFGGSLIAGQYRSALNGVPTASVTTGVVMPTGINSIALGNLASAGGFYLGGHMRRFSYWPRALSQAELTSVTS
jgi:hypothetical protein